MKKKILIPLISACLAIGGALSASVVVAASSAKDKEISKDIIKPLSHIRGEEVNTLPLDIQDWFKKSTDSYENIWNMYTTCEEMSSNHWKLTGPKDYAKKYFRTGTKTVDGTYGNKIVSIPVSFTENGAPEEKTEILLTARGEYKTTYKPGETFNPTNIEVRLHYSNNSTKDVTYEVVWDTNPLAGGTNEVTGVYSYDDKTLEIKVPVLVVDGAVDPTSLIGFTFGGNYQVCYKDWDCLNKENLTITAHYADNSTKDVTNEVAFLSSEFEATLASNRAQQSALYDKWDDFKQINNVLSWEVKEGIEVENYNVVVSLDPQLTKVLYKAQVEEPKYQMMDLYTGLDYYWQVTVNEVGGLKEKSPIYHFKTAKTPRTVYIQGISNTRDIGGYSTRFGEFKQGYVYRGARVDEVTLAGLEVFKDKFGIRTDIDLRTPGSEVGRNNPLDLPYYVGPVDLLMYSQLDPILNPGGYQDACRRLKIAIEPFTHEDNYPIYFHCSVGRDRTGTLASVIEALMGETAEQIIHNYFISVFSVTGHYEYKDIQAGFNNCLSLITMLNHHEGNTLVEQAESLLKVCGITTEQIQKIRDILTGKTSAKNSMKFIENEESYESQYVVSFRQAGNGEEQLFVAPNTVVTAPFTLKDGYAWFNGDEIVDLTKPVTSNLELVAKPCNKCAITIHYLKNEKPDEILNLNQGEIINISDFAMNGITPKAFLDTGVEITRHVVSRNATINLLFD